MQLRPTFAALAVVSLAFAQLPPAETYVDPRAGFSFTSSPGWRIHPREPVQGGPGTCVDLSDSAPDRRENVTICGKNSTADAARIGQVLQSGFENYILYRERVLDSKVTVRPGSLQAGRLNGRDTLTVILDYQVNGRPAASYVVWVESPKTRLSLILQTFPDDLAPAISRISAMRDSIQLP